MLFIIPGLVLHFILLLSIFLPFFRSRLSRISSVITMFYRPSEFLEFIGPPLIQFSSEGLLFKRDIRLKSIQIGVFFRMIALA